MKSYKMPVRPRIEHVHLKLGDIDRALDFIKKC